MSLLNHTDSGNGVPEATGCNPPGNGTPNGTSNVLVFERNAWVPRVVPNPPPPGCVVCRHQPSSHNGNAAANGNGQPITPNESDDDPHRLARLYRDSRCWHDDGLTLRSWRGEDLRWDGAYRGVTAKEINADLGVATKAEFDRLNILAQTVTGKDPQVAKVTNSLVNNVALALRGFTLLDSRIESPAWLTDDPPFPADEVLPARNALFK